MTTFDQRERALENRYAHDEELKFRALARRNDKIGLWAATRLGHEGAAKAEEETQALVAFAVAGEGDLAVVAHLLQAFEHGGVPLSLDETRHRLEAFMAEPQREIQRV